MTAIKTISGRMPRLRTLFLAALTIGTLATVLPLSGFVTGNENGRGLLWSLERGKHAVYFLGSMHVLEKSAYPLPRSIETAYERSDVIVFEVDLDRTTDPRVQGLLMKLGLYPEGKTLEREISEETYGKLASRCGAGGIPLVQIQGFRPWLAALTLVNIELRRLGFDPVYGIDRHFLSRARRDKKRVLFLESMETQLRFFGEMPGHEQEEFLDQTLQELDVIQDMADRMAASWKNGDGKGLYSILHDSFKGHPGLYRALLVDRNRKWQERITRLIERHCHALVIVGAGHLVGPDSLLEMLREQGFRIDQK